MLLLSDVLGMDQDMDMGTDDAAAYIQAVDNVDMYLET